MCACFVPFRLYLFGVLDYTIRKLYNFLCMRSTQRDVPDRVTQEGVKTIWGRGGGLFFCLFVLRLPPAALAFIFRSIQENKPEYTLIPVKRDVGKRNCSKPGVLPECRA